MGTRFQTTSCPLCADQFDDPSAFRDHLAFRHDLVDDEGTETTLEEAPPEPEPEPEPAPVTPANSPGLLPDGATNSASSPGVGPVRLDARVMPGLVLAVALQLVVALLGLSVVDGGGGSIDQVATGSATAGETSRFGDRAAAAAPGGTATTVTSPPPTVDTRNDQARSQQISPQIGDLGPGWTEMNPAAFDSGSGEAELDGAEFDTCFSGEQDLEAAQTGMTDRVFAKEPGNIVLSSALLFRDERSAAGGMSTLRGMMACTGEIFRAGALEEVGDATVTLGSFTPLAYPHYGDESITSSMPVTISVGPGASVPVRLDYLAIREGRAVVFIFVAVIDNALTPTQEQAMLSAVAGRMTPASV